MRLYLLKTQEAARLPEDFCRIWFPKRLTRAAAYRRKADALRCLGAGALLAGVLRVPEDRLEKEPGGRPFVPGKEERFSLAHGGDFVLLAVGRSAVGADVEPEMRRLPRSWQRLCAPEEADWAETEPQTRFFRLWTMKEALLKADGCGLTVRPEAVSVLPLLEQGRMTWRGQRYDGWSGCIDGHCAAVCAQERFSAPEVRVLTAEEILDLTE